MTLPIYSFTYGGEWTKILATDSSASTAFTTYTMLAEASLSSDTDGVIDPSINKSKKANLIQAMFMALDTVTVANDVFNVRITGWNLHKASAESTTGLWVPFQIATLAATVGTTTGVNGTDLGNAYLVCDKLVLTTGDSQSRVVSPADNSVASITFDPMGSRLVQFEFDMDTGAPTLANGMYRLVS